jgi:HlyD family secretion protein
VVNVTDPPPDLRPGLSATAKITTAARSSVLTVPIQALSVRSKAQLEQEKTAPGSVHAAAPAPKEVASKDRDKDQKQDVQGVFVIRNKKAEFVPVTTGVAGTTDIEVVDGLREGDEVITGSYKVLRTLRSGSGVKIDNSVPKKEEESS